MDRRPLRRTRIRSAPAVFLALFTLFLVASCGGKVVFDSGGGGSTTKSPTCLSAVCFVGTTNCSCSGQCFTKNVEEKCTPSPTGFTCQCLISEMMVGSCTETAPGHSCDIKAGCCFMYWGS